MNELLVKYKYINDADESSYIEATTYKGRVAEILPMLKQVDSIRLKDEFYEYISSEFIPSSGKDILDVLYVYVDFY